MRVCMCMWVIWDAPMAAAEVQHPLEYTRCFIFSELFGCLSAVEAIRYWPLRREQVLQTKKEETKEPPLLVSPICAISDPSHLIRPGEGFLHTVLPVLCSHNLHACATFSNARSVRKSLTGFLICATWDPAASFYFSPHKQESFWVLRSSDNKTSRSLWYFFFYASGGIN